MPAERLQSKLYQSIPIESAIDLLRDYGHRYVVRLGYFLKFIQMALIMRPQQKDIVFFDYVLHHALAFG